MERQGQGIDHAVRRVREMAAGYLPTPAVVLLAGSRSRGTARADSDYDLVFLYPVLGDGAWREMVRDGGADFEVFAHDLRTLAYFLEHVERPSGKPVLACMVDEGVVVIGAGDRMEEDARRLARACLAAGPLPLDEAGMAGQRYAIANLALALRSAGGEAERLAIGSPLYVALARFALLANGRWAAEGKALPRALRSVGSELDKVFIQAFAELYARGDDGAVQTLVREVLGPFGGPLRAGYRQQAPASWRL